MAVACADITWIGCSRGADDPARGRSHKPTGKSASRRPASGSANGRAGNASDCRAGEDTILLHGLVYQS